jgi:hypothetical protein
MSPLRARVEGGIKWSRLVLPAPRRYPARTQRVGCLSARVRSGGGGATPARELKGTDCAAQVRIRDNPNATCTTGAACACHRLLSACVRLQPAQRALARPCGAAVSAAGAPPLRVLALALHAAERCSPNTHTQLRQMVLDDVTFARYVMDGEVANVTITVLGGWLRASAGERVAEQNAVVGMRVVRGPDWGACSDDGGAGGVGTLIKPYNSDRTSWYVRWDATGLEEVYATGCSDDGYNRSYRLAVAAASTTAFAWGDVTTRPTLLIGVTGIAEESYGLVGDAEQRITRMTAWLAQNGLVQSGATKDAVTADGKWQRTMIFTRRPAILSSPPREKDTYHHDKVCSSHAAEAASGGAVR